MFKFVVQFLFIFLLLWTNRKAKGTWFSPSGFLIFIYALCSLMAIFTLQIGEWYDPYKEAYWLPMLEFDLFLLVFLLPFRNFNESRISSFSLPSKSFLDKFSVVIILLSFFSILFFIGSVNRIMSMSDLGAARNDHNSGEMYFEVGIFATIASVSAANYVFAIVLYFIYSIIEPKSIRCKLLLLASVSEPIHVLAFVGRDGIVFWIFTFFFCYAFFKDYLPGHTRKQIRYWVLMVMAVLLVPFLLVSIGRFGESNSGTGGSIISYLGQAFIQGPLYFGLDPRPLNIGSGFPLFYQITGDVRSNLGGGHQIIGDWISYRFSTFIVNWYRSFDIYGLIMAAVVMYLLYFFSFGRAKRNIHLGQFTIYILYFQIISEGVFYFRHYTRGGNLFIVTTLLLALLFAISLRGEKQPVILYKCK